MNTPKNDAKIIAQLLLDQTDRAILSADFDGFADVFDLPQMMEIDGQSFEIEDKTDLKYIFDQFQIHLERAPVTLMERHCIAAEFSTEDTIKTTHETRLVSKGQLTEQPYPVFSTLQRCDGVWKVKSTRTEFPRDSLLRKIPKPLPAKT